MSAWEAAAALGIDMESIARNLQLTVDERMLQHDSRLNLILMFERRARENKVALL